MFASAKYARDTRSKDAMYVWLENVNSGSFEVCIREFLPFEGKHEDTILVGNTFFTIKNQCDVGANYKASNDFLICQKRRVPVFENIRHL